MQNETKKRIKITTNSKNLYQLQIELKNTVNKQNINN